MEKPTEQQHPIRWEWEQLTGGKIAPPGHPEFHVPANYFLHFPEQLQRRLREEGELSNRFDLPHKDAVDAWPREMPYEVPEQYFEAFPDRLMQKLKAEQASRAKSKWLPQRVMAIALAACLAGLCVVGWWMYQQHQSLQARLERIPTEAIAQYLEQHTDLFNSDLIVRQLDNIEANQLLPGNSEITPEDIREYLDLDSLPDASFWQ